MIICKSLTIMSSIILLFKALWINNNKYKLLIVISFIMIILSSIGLALVPLIFKHSIDLIKSNLEQKNTTTTLIYLILLSYGIAWLLIQSMAIIRAILSSIIINKSLTKMVSKLSNQLIDLDYNSHTNKKTGELISIIDRFMIAVPQFIEGIFIQIVPIAIEVIVALFVVVKLFGLIYGTTLLFTILLFLILSLITSKKSIVMQLRENEEKNKFSNYLLDILQNYDNVKYFNNEDFEKTAIKKILESKQTTTNEMYLRVGFINILQIIIVGLGLLIITMKSGYDVINNELTLGDFVLLNTYVLQFSIPFSYFGYVVQGIRRAYVDINVAILLLNKKKEDNSYNIIQPDCFKHIKIDFINVTYCSPDTNKVILKNISFQISNGKTLAIIGKTGAGKSTIVKLILGVITPTSGQILINDIELKNIPPETVFGFTGIVPQDCSLFNRTVIENIRYGNLSSTENDINKIIECLSLTHLKKDNRTIGERAVKISGGEKQRIAIARILLKNPSFCVFDEFTSSLDINTEKNILQLISELFKKQTKLIIAHKLHTIQSADHVIVLEDGLIKSEGTYNHVIED